MEMNLKLKRSSKQHQNSKIAKDTNQNFQREQSSNYKDRSKVNNVVSSSNCDRKYEVGPDAHIKDSVQQESLSNHQSICPEGNTIKDDEPVRYMSNLPGYLQRLDSVNFQGNALNVGVLDWSRLENWKDKKKNSFDTADKTASSSRSKSTVNSFSSGVRSKTSGHPNKQCSSASNASSSFDMGGSKSFAQIQDFETAPVRKMDRQKTTAWSSVSFDRYPVDEMIVKEKQKYRNQELNSERGVLLSSRRDVGVLHDQEKILRSQVTRVERKPGEQQEFSSCRKRSEGISHKSRPSSSTIINHEESSSSENKTNPEKSETNWRPKELQDSKASPDHQHIAIEPKNSVLYPETLRRGSFSEVSPPPKPGTSATGKLVGGGVLTRQSKNYDTTGCIPNESHSAEIHYGIPKLSRMHTRVEGDTKQNVQFSLKTEKNDVSSDVSHELPDSSENPEMLPKHIPVEKHTSMKTKNLYSVAGKPKEKCGLHMKAGRSELNDTLKILDQETAELAAKRSRNPSSNQRFSFNLHRLGRSFSFKECPGVPQLSSSYVPVKSGPATSEASAHLYTAKAEKENGNNRAKASPFRRLLDPLLRSKGANLSQSRDTGEQLQNFDLNFVPGRSHKKGKGKESEVKAILKLTVKNGLPLYKFVVDNDSNIFAATMKNFSVPGKDDSGQNYTFYSINEIKKSAGWLGQGSKRKSTRYAYNVVGQMKVSSYSTSELAEQKTSSNYMVIESILFDVDKRQADKELPELFPDKELAAVVVRIPSKILSYGGQLSVEDKGSLTKSHSDYFSGDECLLKRGRTGLSNNITVILPGGVHSLPFEGEPSPLISRWKSGGSCDCGGWDVGCSLHILSNDKKSCDQETSSSCSTSNHFELFDQVTKRNGRPVFSLAPLENGIHSVRFNTSISLLQAFFISVAVVSNQQPSNVSDFSKLAEVILQENEFSGIDQETKPTIDRMQVLGKYVSPPYSPIGRV